MNLDAFIYGTGWNPNLVAYYEAEGGFSMYSLILRFFY